MSIDRKIRDGVYYDPSTHRITSRPPGLVLPGSGMVVERVNLTAGSADATKRVQPARMTDAGQASEAARYRAEIMSLPEASERPASAEKIAMGYGFKSMPVARAASILRGLPSEIDELVGRASERQAARAAAAAPEDPKLQRRVELRILGLRGAVEPEQRRERTALQLALATARESRISVTAALARVGIDAAQFAG